MDTLEQQETEAESAVIRNAYIGTWPGQKLTSENPSGLNVTLDFETGGTASISYKKMEDINGN